MDAAALVDRLELDLWTAGVCLPCLTFVAFPLESGDEGEPRQEARRLAPELWEDGLDVTTATMLERACLEHVPGAAEALADVRRRGARSTVVAAIIWRLAELMVEDIRAGGANRQREPSGASARTGWPVTSAINSKSWS